MRELNSEELEAVVGGICQNHITANPGDEDCPPAGQLPAFPLGGPSNGTDPLDPR